MARGTVRFPVADSESSAARISVTSRSGRVEVFAEDRADLEVEGAARAGSERDDAGEQVVVESTHEHVVVRCPQGTEVSVGTLSGRVVMTGELGSVRITTSSGRVDVGATTSLDVRTRSGRIGAGPCRGVIRARSTSGRVIVESADQCDVTTTSGTIVVGPVHEATVRSTSGRVELALERGGSVAARTVSGRVEVTVVAGVEPELRLRSISGRITFPPESETVAASDRVGTIGVDTISGRIKVTHR